MTQIISNLNKTALVVDHPIGQDNPPLLLPDTHSDSQEIPTQHVLQMSDFAVNWEDKLTDKQLDTFVTDGWLIIDDVFNSTALLALQAESGFIDYRDAELTAGVRISDIRGDRIRWITEYFFAGYYYLQSINALASLFNRSLFAGIRHSEAHYACYPTGFGYQWHSDNPAGRDERVISAVFFISINNWEAADGGALEVVDKHGTHHEVIPVANRLIIFDSDLRHQVQIAHRQRYSIATWMRRDGLVPFVEVAI
ncbi:LOW QUALITY PROTEIN: SM-20-related protein [Psychrobacter sp. JCM 18901]|nr:LOW QUALITY PROTEIN: SM-20-related protein [Psychrobacter sp. JCM 18901]